MQEEVFDINSNSTQDSTTLLSSFSAPVKSKKPVIEFKGVSKTYKTGTHALEDVNIQIN